MRRIGTLSNEQDARRFADYLFSLDIKIRVDEVGDHWEIWGLDEDGIDMARLELEQFRAAPQDGKYAAASRDAQQKRDAELRQAINARKRQVNLRERWERPGLLQTPVTIALIAASIAVTLICEFGRNDELTSRLQIQQSVADVKPSGRGWIEYSQIFLQDIRRGEVWRLITPIFIHLSALHLFGNMYWTAVFGGMIERRQRSWSLLWKVVLIGVISNLVQYIAAGPAFGGMSGVGYGLFGYIWMKGHFDPDDGIGLPRDTIVFFLIWLVLCSIGLIGPIANWAHSAGLVTGMLLAAPAAIRQWLK
jgi:GlpG protein